MRCKMIHTPRCVELIPSFFEQRLHTVLLDIKVCDGRFLGASQKIRHVSDCQINRTIRDVFVHHLRHITMQKRGGSCQLMGFRSAARCRSEGGMVSQYSFPLSPR